MAVTAEEFARNAHLGQMYGSVPYYHHLQSVVTILADFGFTGIYADAGWLHDTVEEPKVKETVIEELFGSEVRNLVHACYGKGSRRPARNADMYYRISQCRKAVPLKMADRIAHVEAAEPNSKHAMMYIKERAEFDEFVAEFAPIGMRARLVRGYRRIAPDKTRWGANRDKPLKDVR